MKKINGISKRWFILGTVLSAFLIIFSGLAVKNLHNILFVSATYLSKGKTESTSSSIKGYVKTVIIDPGHGGVDPGAIGIGNVQEKTINLDVALKLKENLKKEGYTVIMTREDDREINDPEYTSLYDKKQSDLRNRVKLTKEYPRGIYISIHQNYNPDSEYNGTQVYYSVNNSDSKNLASMIQAEVKNKLQPGNDREIQSDHKLYILKNSMIPTVLIECAFISNPTDSVNIQNSNYQNKFISAIVTAVDKFYRAYS